jgi:hypothetical protein
MVSYARPRGRFELVVELVSLDKGLAHFKDIFEVEICCLDFGDADFKTWVA